MGSQQSQSAAQDLASLCELAMEILPTDGSCVIASVLHLVRHRSAEHVENCMYRPLIGLALQGRKQSVLGTRQYSYGAGECLVVNIDMPNSFSVTEGSEEKPFLAVWIEIDRYLISRLSTDLPPLSSTVCNDEGVSVIDAPAEIVNAFLRLIRLAKTPEQVPFLAPGIIQEIHYRLMIGPLGAAVRHFGTRTTHCGQIVYAVEWLKEHFRQPLQVSALAALVNMGVSTFHRYFKDVTSLSPLQYHKRLRLYEAQRLMMAGSDASRAAVSVGYESPTQFNREYKRMFGEPPHRDVLRRLGQ